MAGSIPLALWAGYLSLALLHAAAAVEGPLTVFYKTAFLTVLPRLVAPSQLTTAAAWVDLIQDVALSPKQLVRVCGHGHRSGFLPQPWYVKVASRRRVTQSSRHRRTY